jgi:hypothetical protein
MSTLLQLAPRGTRNWPSPHTTPHNRPRAERRALPKAAPPGKGRPQADSRQSLPRGAAWRGPARSTDGHGWKLWP